MEIDINNLIVSFAKSFASTKIYELIQNGSFILLPCEINFNEKGEPVKRQDLFGINIAKKLRREGVTAPIIFTSFLSRKQVYANKPEREILKFPGHGFVQLPATFQDFQKEAKKFEKLTPLELKDVQLFACNPDGIVNAKVHQLPSLADKLKTKGSGYVMKELENCISEIHLAFQVSPDLFLSQFNNQFPTIHKENVDHAIEAVLEKAKNLINDYRRKITGKAEIQGDAKKPWKLLLLDDELNKESRLVKLLEENGVNVICTSTAIDAMKALEKDKHLRSKITVVVTDYRLYEMDEDGMQVQQKVQGYRFLQNVGEKFYSRIMTAIVYSGMPRQFLLDNLQTFKIGTEKYSKIDFKPSDAGAMNYLVSRIIELGEKNYETLLSLPLGNAGWRNHLHEYYLKYRSLPDYESKERTINEECKRWVDQFRNNQSPATPMIKGDAFEAKQKETEAQTIERFIVYYKTRRLAQYLYLYFENHRRSKIRYEVANILMHPAKSRENPKTIDGFFSQILGLSVTEFPFGATIEELNWFEYDLEINVLDSYRRYRDRFNAYEKLIGEFICDDRALVQLLKNKNYHVEGERGHKIIFNEETYSPYLFDKMDLGFCIEWLNGQKENFNKQGTEEYLQLIKKLKEAWN